MKILFCHNNLKLVDRLLERPLAAGNVLVQCVHGRDLIPMLASAEPHLVVIGGDKLGASPKSLERDLREAGFRTPILIMQENRKDDGLLDDIWRSLKALSGEPVPPEYDPQNYIVLGETSLSSRCGCNPETAEILESQENRFLAMLGAGMLHHSRSATYLKISIETERNYQREWASAVISGHAMGYLWRAQLFRYVSTLAHYIPGVDAKCLALPHPSSPKLDFVHKALSAEAFYGLNAVRTFGMNPKLEKILWEVGQIETTQNERLADDVSRLAGWSSVMREAAVAHVQVIGACLSNDPARLAELAQNRHTRILSSIFTEFWDLNAAIGCSGGLQRLTNEFHHGRRAVGIREFESFFEFVDRIQQQEQNHLITN
jgi:hypothetical protein